MAGNPDYEVSVRSDGDREIFKTLREAKSYGKNILTKAMTELFGWIK